MKNKILFLLILGGSVILFGRTSFTRAAPIQWAGNGHYYEMLPIQEGLTWIVAKDTANSQYWLGYQGHLAAITSEAENDFIKQLVGTTEAHLAWLGGHIKEGSVPDPDNWEWGTGETWSYTNWKDNEPTSLLYENALQMYGTYDCWGQWNDTDDTHVYESQLNISAVVEYVPEPATLSLLTLGGLTLFRKRRA